LRAVSYRRQVLNIGVDPAHISTQLRVSVDETRHRWEHAGDWTFAAAQNSGTVELYDWRIDRARYVRLLRAYDGHRDPQAPSAFIPVYSL
jgi:hypothetical protein